MVKFFSLDDVGQSYDMVRAAPERIAAKLGRHPNDLMLSYYMQTLDHILVECGWGGREVDDATWQSEEMTSVGSMWGHQGLFEALGDPDMRVQERRHAPVQVIDGNYQKMTGVCPWWDSMRRNWLAAVGSQWRRQVLLRPGRCLPAAARRLTVQGVVCEGAVRACRQAGVRGPLTGRAPHLSANSMIISMAWEREHLK